MASTITVSNASGVVIRRTASSTGQSIGALGKGSKATATSFTNGYYYLPTYNGYVDKTYVSIDKEIVNTTSVTTSTQTTSTNKAMTSISSNNSNGTSTKNLLTKNMHGIHAMPYQFMSTVDRRLDGTEFGRKYAEKIVARMPLLFLTPGKQVFMSEFSKQDKTGALTTLAEMIHGNTDTDIDKLVNDVGRYYTFQFDYANYYGYVNTMARSVAKLLGVGKEKITIGKYSEKLELFDWSRVLNSDFNSYFTAKENVVFYINASSTISETFSNETRESSLVSTINGTSDTVKELQFIIGNKVTDKIINANDSGIGNVLSSITSVIDNYLGGGGVLNSITSGGINSILSGGKLVFPELWSDSDYSTSYDIDIKLRSPDHDDLSIYLNCIIPYIHLLAMTAPRGYNSNSYTAPFLVRAFYKGSFNIDMGIITSLSVTKGAEGAWNDTGLPTQMDISLTIKDLYTSFFISKPNNILELGQVVNNTAMMDYLANMAGINMSDPELTRKMSIYLTLAGAAIKNVPNSAFNKLENGISNLMGKLYR